MFMCAEFHRKPKSLFSRLRHDKKGAALVEYALLVAGIALVSLVAVSLLGEKTAEMIGSVAAVLPGAHADDNGSLVTGSLVEHKFQNGQVVLDVDRIAAGANTERLGTNLGSSLTKLVNDTGP
jgi:Flp pilus assembly pilin Flp